MMKGVAVLEVELWVPEAATTFAQPLAHNCLAAFIINIQTLTLTFSGRQKPPFLADIV